ncbi:MAG TPA: TadE/TadG family type IV pilus assembly protein [Telluria sp.]|nr:TadE/TadG family type IV pilus assembly protein [Telluria sp.]
MKPVNRSREAGAAAVEMAFVMLGALVMMAGTWAIGNALWQYSELEAAAYDAAALVASATPSEMADLAGFDAVEDSASALVVEAAERSGSTFQSIDIECIPDDDCVLTGTRSVQVEVEAFLQTDLFPIDGGGDGIPVTINVEVPYAGRIQSE